jgi:hypothetical protein
MGEPRIFHGARAKLRKGGDDIGWASGIRGTVNYNVQPFEEVGTPIIPAIEIVGVTVDFTTSFVRIMASDPVKDGMLPSMDADAIIDWEDVELDIVDAVDPDKIIYRIIGCHPASMDFEIGARSLCGYNIRWVAREFKHESEG